MKLAFENNTYTNLIGRNVGVLEFKEVPNANF